MTARLYRTEPCWLVDNDPWESPHFDTEAKAITGAMRDTDGRDEDNRKPHRVVQEPHPCWVVTCDHPDCDNEDEGDYDMGGIHHVNATPPVLAEGAQPGDWLCPDHAPEPEWLRRINAELNEAGL